MPNRIPKDILIIKYIDIIVKIMQNKLNLLNIYINYKNQGNFV